MFTFDGDQFSTIYIQLDFFFPGVVLGHRWPSSRRQIFSGLSTGQPDLRNWKSGKEALAQDLWALHSRLVIKYSS